MYIYTSAQAKCLNIRFIYHCSIPTGFLPNSRDAIENGCGIPYDDNDDDITIKVSHSIPLPSHLAERA